MNVRRRPACRWASGVDRLLAGGRYVVMLTDLDVPSAEEIRNALATIAAAGPHTRIGLQPTPTHLWRYRSAPDVPVHELPATVAASPPAAVLEYVARHSSRRLPLEIHLSGHQLVIDASHALGDGVFTVDLFEALLDIGDVEQSRWLTNRETRLPLWRATARTFGANPRRLLEAVKLHGARGVTRSQQTAVDQDPSIRRIDWAPSLTASTVVVDAGTVAEMNRWRQAHVPSCSMSAIWLVVAHRALGAAGLPIDDDVMVAFNCRRYLSERSLVSGNFAAGVEVRVGPGRPPTEVGGNLRDIGASALPLASLNLLSALVQVRRRVVAEPPPAEALMGAPVRLMYSDLGRLSRLDDAPWRPGTMPSYSGLLDPATPESLTIISTSIRDARTLSATFHDNVFDRVMVDDAMRRLRDEPLTLLAGDGG